MKLLETAVLHGITIGIYECVEGEHIPAHFTRIVRYGSKDRHGPIWVDFKRKFGAGEYINDPEITGIPGRFIMRTSHKLRANCLVIMPVQEPDTNEYGEISL